MPFSRTRSSEGEVRSRFREKAERVGDLIMLEEMEEAFCVWPWEKVERVGEGIMFGTDWEWLRPDCMGIPRLR